MSTAFPNPPSDVAEPPPSKPGVLRETFRGFQYRNFRLMWFGAFISTSGFFVQEVAQSWLVYDLTNSEFYLGLAAFLNGAPILLLSLLGGVAADRMDRRKLLLGSQYVQMSSALVLAALVALDMIQVWHILAAAFVNGLGQAFGGPAFQALIPSLVDKEDLPNAIALMSIQFTLARVVGSVAGGMAFAILGAFACFTINGASFLAVIVSLYIIQVRFVPKKTDVHVLESLKEGLRFVYRSHVILALVILAPVTAFLGVPLVTLLPVFARETFHLDPQGYSMMLAFWGSGAVVGALHCAWLGNAPNKGRTTLLMQVGLGATIVAFAVSGNLWVACVFLFFSGWTVLAVFALVNSLVQLQAQEEMRGRIMSVYHTAFRGAMPLGNLAIGALASQIGAAAAVSASGVLLVLVAVWYLLRDKQVTQL
jgi:predicted MFS family arabinose efflux permease